MEKVTFITGNQSKADYLAKYLGHPVDHLKIQKPVIVEDVSLEFAALNGLPGPFIKFFTEKVPFDTICAMLNGKTRKATARCVFGYFDGSDLELFESSLEGEVPLTPAGDNGYGWDKIYIPQGYSVTRASLNEEDDRKTYLLIKPFAKLKTFLDGKHGISPDV
mgnify:CR=1 FL=1